MHIKFFIKMHRTFQNGDGENIVGNRSGKTIESFLIALLIKW
jgi:hypothetical protein